MRHLNWFTHLFSNATVGVFSIENGEPVFRGYLDQTDTGWFWEDRFGRRVGPFAKAKIAFQAFCLFAAE